MRSERVNNGTKRLGAGGPTVELRAEAFRTVPGSLFRRTWEPIPAVPVHRAEVYTESALAAALAIYGTRVAGLLEASGEDTWRITARCLITGAAVGEWTWVRSEETGRWVPAGEPWCVWDDRLRVEALERANAKAANVEGSAA